MLLPRNINQVNAGWLWISSPKNFSVNDGIDPAWLSLLYVSIDHLSSLILSLGTRTMLIKADIKEAYRMVPIHSQDQWLLGVQWKGEVFINRMLWFVLCSTPKIFSSVTNALRTWILSIKGITHILHYLDDYIITSITTFFTFCRSGETTVENKKPYDPKVHLSYSDITANSSVSPNVISLSIKQSKMDQFRKEIKVVIG